MNKVVFKSTMMQTVYDFCLKTLKDLVEEHKDEVFNYQVSVDIAPSLNEAKGSVESSIDTLSESQRGCGSCGRRDKKYTFCNKSNNDKTWIKNLREKCKYCHLW